MDITYKAIAGQTRFSTPGNVASAVTVDGSAADFTAFPGGFILDDATAADDLVVATFTQDASYVGTRAADVADLTVTATSGTLPTANGSVTIANAATPTVAELLEYCRELEAKVEAITASLRASYLMAS
jgi:hypothetical protein